MKYINIFLIIILSFVFTNQNFTQEIELRTKNSVLHQIIQSYEAGEIDYQTMIKNRIYAITNPDLLDQKFKSIEPIIEKCATTNVMEIREYLDKQLKNDIPKEVINGFTGILARPTKQKYLVSPSGRFRIQYDTTGTHAVYQPTVDVNPADGHPDYVNRCAEIFDYVYDIEITQMGYTPPPPDGTAGGGNNEYDVYLHSYSGAYGVTFTDGTVSGYGNPPRTAYKSYIYCDPTYTGFGYTDRTLPLKVTAAHEFFHAIQFAYNANAGSWFMEISSTWIEDIVYDNINDYRYYLPTFFNSPQVSLTKFDGSHEYASCIFGHYISENFGNDRMKRIWDYTINAGSNIALNAIQSALVEIGTNRSDVFAGFTVWNYLTGSRANGTHPTYSEGAYFPQVNIAATHSSYPVSAIAPTGLEFLATFYYHFNPVSNPSNLRLGFNQISSSAWKGKVVVDSSSRFKSFDVDLSSGTGLIDLLSFNNKTRAVFIPANVATSGSNLSYTYTANIRLLPVVVYPNGGEIFYIDSIYTILWNSSDIDSLKIEYTTNNGLDWLTISKAVSASAGSYLWQIPETPTTQAKIKITSTLDTNLFDISNNVFSIKYTPQISIILPDSGEIFPVGFSKNIQWNSINVDGNVKIELSRDGGDNFEILFSNTANDGTESWVVTGPITEQARIKISSIDNPSIYKISRANFYIREATISLISPIGGDTMRIGTEHTIQWVSTNMSGPVKIMLSRDGGSIYDTIIDSTNNDGEENWLVNGPQTTTAKIKITSVENNQVYDTSNSNFNIFPQDFVTVLKPIINESLLIDSIYTINWESFGTSGNVKIELSRDNGETFETLINSTPDDGIEVIDITGPATHNALIKISDTELPSLSGLSENFIIGAYDTINYYPGWNLISLKGYIGNKNKEFLFPSAQSNAFKFNSGYSIVDVLNYGDGYWIKFSENGFSRNISAPRYEDTIQVVEGWNLLGGLSVPIAVNNIECIPSNLISSFVYGYMNGYKVLDTISPGKAVWLKASQNGTLILSNLNKMFNNIYRPEFHSQAIIINFADGANNTQSLFLLKSDGSNLNEEIYSLPPLPPNSAFDVRFETDKNNYFYDNSYREIKILLQGVNFPLKLNLFSNDDLSITVCIDDYDYNLSELKGIIINERPKKDLIMKLNPYKQNNIPKSYYLSQNYPNPFNPTTVIRYGIPEDGYVILKVYDILGNEVSTLVNQYQLAGNYEILFNDNNNLPNGVFYYQLKVNNYITTKKAILVK